MKKKLKKIELFSRIISFEDNLILPDFFGRNDENLKKIEDAFGVSIFPRGNYLKIEGLQEDVEHTDVVLNKLYEGVKKNKFLSLSDFKNDLDNIEQIPYHDSMFLPYGKHKINPKLQSFDPWDFDINKKSEDKLIKDNLWYYSEFYPEVLEVSKT